MQRRHPKHTMLDGARAAPALFTIGSTYQAQCIRHAKINGRCGITTTTRHARHTHARHGVKSVFSAHSKLYKPHTTH